MAYIEYILNQRPIIAAVKEPSDLEEIPSDKIAAIFVLGSDISTLSKIVDAAIKLDKLVFLHLDLVKGVAKDKYGIKYLAEEIGIDGVITTKSYLIKEAKKQDLITVQRLFILDSSAVEMGINVINKSSPDLVEVLPGIAFPYLAERLKDELEQPIIAGGLIRNNKDVDRILDFEALAISTSSKELWNWS
ncbi:glycerol-3-phosphate responsive antiterminator [Sporohalobacter salinus]|uniref:glycerol-3-phosphate responsive antiterminator n=1 Tax=Sporohalobacter salinus TaxID=1494606 RepID=UPI00195FEE66|nr:glycerol uptake operon antiterminator [Sporohalobacter salinus]